MKDLESQFFKELTRKESAPFNVATFFSDAPFAKFANSPMETAAKQQGWEIPEVKPQQPMDVGDMKVPNPAQDLKTVKPNMITKAVSNTQKMVQQKANNPTGVSNGQGFNAA